MNVLVTGGAGYIGCHTVRALQENGDDPVVFDDLSSGHCSLVQEVRMVEGDVRDGDRLGKTIRDHHIEAVIHFAARCLVGESMTHPAMYPRDNLGMTVSVCEAMVGTDCPTIVVSSSAAVYGTPARIPIAEDDLLAQPPIPTGSRRFSRSRPWNGMRNSTAFGPPACAISTPPEPTRTAT